MKKAVFVIATQYDNLGDLIINKCLIDELSQHVDLYVDTKNVPQHFVRNIEDNIQVKSLGESYDLSFKDLRILRLFLQRKLRFDYFFKSPGPIGIGKQSFKVSIKFRIYEKIISLVNKRIGKAYIIGSEINLATDNSRNVFKSKSKLYTGIFLRSYNNIENLKSLGIVNLKYIPDLCFLMKDKITYQKNLGRKKVGISFRDLCSSELNAKIERTVDNYISFFSEKNYEIQFFFQVTRDHEYNLKLYSKYVDNPKVTFLEDSIAYQDIHLYNDFEAVLSNRLHVLLLGIAHNSLAFPLVDKHKKTYKIIEIFDSIDATIKPCGELNTMDINNIYKEIDYHKNSIVRINQTQYKLCKEALAGIFS